MLYCSKTNIRDETGLYFANHKKTPPHFVVARTVWFKIRY